MACVWQSRHQPSMSLLRPPLHHAVPSLMLGFWQDAMRHADLCLHVYTSHSAGQCSSNHLRTQYAIEVWVLRCSFVASLDDISLQASQVRVAAGLEIGCNLLKHLDFLHVAYGCFVMSLAAFCAIGGQCHKEMASARVDAIASVRESATSERHAVRLVRYFGVLPLRLQCGVCSRPKLHQKARQYTICARIQQMSNRCGLGSEVRLTRVCSRSQPLTQEHVREKAASNQLQEPIHTAWRVGPVDHDMAVTGRCH
jgi:hypothetical protein